MEGKNSSDLWGTIIFIGILYLCFNNSRSYDSGYEKGWLNEKLSAWASQKEKDGYEDGANDTWMYDQGFEDSKRNNKPKYPNDFDYMDGYTDGKR